MRTIRTKVYKFDELSKDAQKKAIEVMYDINYNGFDWWEGTYEDAKEIGLKITGFGLDRSRGATGEFLLAANEVAQNIFNAHGESCKTYKTATSFMENWQPVFDNYMATEEGESELIEIENDFLNSLLEDYSIILQNESEYIGSEEAIKETIEANEYEFTKEGNRF